MDSMKHSMSLIFKFSKGGVSSRVSRGLFWTLLCFSFGMACSGEDKKTSTEQVEVEVQTPAPFEGELLQGLPLARRISMDVRGEFLDMSEVQRVLADPSSIAELTTQWMQQEGHKAELINIFSSMLLTKVDEFNVTQADFYLDEAQGYDFVQSIGEESPRLMAHIAMSDVPWTAVVNAEYTMANSILMDIWNLEPMGQASTGVDDWVQAQYTDGRPPLGVVSTNGIWWRYYTTPNNKSRARAAFLTRLLVCDDILSRAVTSPSSLQVDAQNIDEFVRTDPGCLSCHRTLDPLAASLYGFWQHDMHDVVELSIYHPEREWDGERDLQLEMGWYGQPLSAPAELGEAIASDERFYGCAVSSLAERLWRRPIQDSDEGRIETISHEAQQAGGRYADIVRGILDSPEYQMSLPEDSTDERTMSAAKMMSAHQLRHAISEFTGFDWNDGTLELLDNDEWGYRMLLGGIDGRSTTQWLEAPSATRQLTLKRFAQLAAEHAVSQAMIESESSEVFNQLDPLSVSVDDAAFQDIVGQWYQRLMGREPTEEELSILQEGFESVERDHGLEQAWSSLLSILLRNSQTWLY